jgi:hypothetical protein
MTTYSSLLLKRFRSKGVLVDSNLLLLLLVGSFDTNLLTNASFKRVAKYTVEDFETLLRLLRYFKVLVTTAHILTEVSNLAGQLPGHLRSPCFGEFLRVFVPFAELNRSSFSAAARQEFPYLGLTDCIIADAATDYLVVTDDLRFCNSLETAGIEALNFNHIRTSFWEPE